MLSIAKIISQRVFYFSVEIQDIAFYKGDIITNIKTKNGSWYFGSGPDGKRGMFPSNYVKLIQNGGSCICTTIVLVSVNNSALH